MKLRAIAHARSGDKGNISNIAVIALDGRDYPWIECHVTIDRVRGQFAGIVKGDIDRYELPAIGALNFVLHDALGGGVTRSTALDAHGKCLSSLMLDLEIPERKVTG